MIVRVRRLTFDDYMSLLILRGSQAHYFDVPSTLNGVKFRGVYTTSSCQEIAVAWPTNRPDEDQKEFSKKAQCGEPVEEFEIADTLN